MTADYLTLKRGAAALLIAAAALVTAGPAMAENRCGWIHNPTPGNWWLTDADGSWTILTQGSDYEPSGMENIPDISTRQYVATNGNYGYGCACMEVETDAAEGSITAIYSFRQLSLAKCRNDGNLQAPE